MRQACFDTVWCQSETFLHKTFENNLATGWYSNFNVDKKIHDGDLERFYLSLLFLSKRLKRAELI